MGPWHRQPRPGAPMRGGGLLMGGDRGPLQAGSHAGSWRGQGDGLRLPAQHSPLFVSPPPASPPSPAAAGADAHGTEGGAWWLSWPWFFSWPFPGHPLPFSPRQLEPVV